MLKLNFVRIYNITDGNVTVPLFYDVRANEDTNVKIITSKIAADLNKEIYSLHPVQIDYEGKPTFVYKLMCNNQPIENTVQCDKYTFDLRELDKQASESQIKAIKSTIESFDKNLLSEEGLKIYKSFNKKVITKEMITPIFNNLKEHNHLSITDVPHIVNTINNIIPNLILNKEEEVVEQQVEPSVVTNPAPQQPVQEPTPVQQPVQETPQQPVQESVQQPTPVQPQVQETSSNTSSSNIKIIKGNNNQFSQDVDNLTSLMYNYGIEVEAVNEMFHQLIINSNIFKPTPYINQQISYLFGNLGLETSVIINAISALDDNIIKALFNLIVLDTETNQPLNTIPMTTSNGYLTFLYIIDELYNQEYNGLKYQNDHKRGKIMNFLSAIFEHDYVVYKYFQGMDDEDGEEDGISNKKKSITPEEEYQESLNSGITLYKYVIDNLTTNKDIALELSKLFINKANTKLPDNFITGVKNLSLKFDITNHSFYSGDIKLNSIVLGEIYSNIRQFKFQCDNININLCFEYWKGLSHGEQNSILGNGMIEKISITETGEEIENQVSLADLLDIATIRNYLMANQYHIEGGFDFNTEGRKIIKENLKNNPTNTINTIIRGNINGFNICKDNTIRNILVDTLSYYNSLDSIYKDEVYRLEATLKKYNEVLADLKKSSNSIIATNCVNYSALLDLNEAEYEYKQLIIFRLANSPNKKGVCPGIIATNKTDNKDYFIPSMGNRTIDLITSKQINLNLDKKSDPKIPVYDVSILNPEEKGNKKYLKNIMSLGIMDKSTVISSIYKDDVETFSIKSVINYLRVYYSDKYSMLNLPKWVKEESNLIDEIFKEMARGKYA